MLHFIMPPDGIEPRLVDEVFRPRCKLLRARGYPVSLVDDGVFRGDGALRGIAECATVIYRGWMVKVEEYRHLERSVESLGASLPTDTEAYARTHQLPGWYEVLAEFTAETVCVSDPDELMRALKRLGWPSYFLKDYVKSLKVAGGSIVRSEADAARWLDRMIEYRDELEGGICIRRVEKFLPESERRYFVFDGVVYAPDDRPVPHPVEAVAHRIASRFFSIDVAETTEHETRIVELGDGQVSDLVGWTPERFSEIWPRP